MANYLVTDAQLQDIANKIRQKTGGSAAIQFYSAFVSEIEKLTDTRDANASASDILNGKTAYVNKNKVTGNIPSKGSNDVSVSGNTVSVPTGHYPSAVQKTVGTAKAAATYNTSILDQTIAAGQYLSGAQTIKGVTTENIDAGNIKPGVRIRVGDANNAGRIKDVTGMMPEIGNTTYNTDTNDSVLPPGSYVSGVVTIKGVTTQNIDAGNIKAGVNVKVGDANSAGRIKNVTGTFTSDANATASDIKNGKTAYVNGNKITGNYTPGEYRYIEYIPNAITADGEKTMQSGGTCTITNDIQVPSGYDANCCGIFSVSPTETLFPVEITNAYISSGKLKVDLKNHSLGAIVFGSGDTIGYVAYIFVKAG